MLVSLFVHCETNLSLLGFLFIPALFLCNWQFSNFHHFHLLCAFANFHGKTIPRIVFPYTMRSWYSSTFINIVFWNPSNFTATAVWKALNLHSIPNAPTYNSSSSEMKYLPRLIKSLYTKLARFEAGLGSPPPSRSPSTTFIREDLSILNQTPMVPDFPLWSSWNFSWAIKPSLQ